jgi:hypothetical protein
MLNKTALNKIVRALAPSTEGGPDVFKCSKIDKEILSGDGCRAFILAHFDVL